ncbi:MAG: hypothetical protein KAS53_11360 [Candidatus Cloacimonetes bacterium]|nr:hypothetical protein [Candidatus Cloacimonadota bacterium]
MKNTFKKFFTLLVISGFGYLGLKIYQLFKGLIELDKTLPQYLGNIIGEVPNVSIVAVFNKITITVKFKKDVIKKNEGLEKIISDYVTDFYPIFKADNVNVLIEELKEEKEKTAPKEKK